jgi:hypothetical protein
MEEWLEGQQRFIEYNCPVRECILTSDYANKRLTADALLITQVDSTSVQKHLPKPPHQIWIVRHQVNGIHMQTIGYNFILIFKFVCYEGARERQLSININKSAVVSLSCKP